MFRITLHYLPIAMILASNLSAAPDDQPAIKVAKLGFAGECIQLSPNGKRALVLGRVIGSPTKSTHIAIVDLESATVLSNRKMPMDPNLLPAPMAHIDNDYLFFVRHSKDQSDIANRQLCRVDHLMKNERRLSLELAPGGILKIAPNQLIVGRGKRCSVIGKDAFYVDIATMKRAKIGTLKRTYKRIVSLNSRYVVDGGRLIDCDSWKTVRFLNASGLPEIMNLKKTNRPALHWGLDSKSWRNSNSRLANSELSKSGWAPGTNDMNSTSSERLPIAFRYETQSTMELKPVKLIKDRKLRIFDLLKGEERLVLQLNPPAITNVNYGIRRFGDIGPPLHQHDKILANFFDVLLIVEFPSQLRENLGMPLHFTQLQKRELKVGKIETFQIGVAGNTNGVTFALTTELDGMSIDASTGEVTIDTVKVWNTHVDEISAKPARKPNAEAYNELTGRKLPRNSLAATIPISAVFTDSAEREQSMSFCVVISGPRNQVK